MPDFELIPGVYIASTDGVERSYRAEEGRIVLALSSKSYQKLSLQPSNALTSLCFSFWRFRPGRISSFTILITAHFPSFSPY